MTGGLPLVAPNVQTSFYQFHAYVIHDLPIFILQWSAPPFLYQSEGDAHVFESLDQVREITQLQRRATP